MVKDRTKRKLSAMVVSWKELSEVLDDCNIQEERLDEANDTH